MNTITPEQIARCYEVSKKVYESNGSIPKREGIRELHELYGMNQSSATTYIRAFQHLITGKPFNRTLSAESFDYFLKNIFVDYGISKLQTALLSLHGHILYFEEIEETQMHTVRNIYENYFRQIPEFAKDEVEQLEIEKFMVDEYSREQIIADLKALRQSDTEIVEINRKAYKRDNKTVVQLKILRNYKCQICNHQILKKDGKFYIEAAHIKPKSKKGRECPNNILILCPNHHKEFDHGRLEVLKHTDDFIHFLLNTCEYKIMLSLT